MHLYKTKTNKRVGKKWIAIAVVVVLVIGGTYWRLRIYKPASEVITTAGNLTQSTAPSTSTNSPPPKKQPTSNVGLDDGGAADTSGQTTATTNQSQWITSKSGAITVEQPVANATLSSGDYLVGTAKVGAVSFRLSDTSDGQIATGTLQVVNGKFSGKLSFTAHSSDGELDVFSTNSQGVEFNIIQIAVKFK
jgi:hypothetical protein